ncbi:DUF4388 domain-containing protein [candidate division WOR-3 bacterium]|nr:DUF4388 domain-containing protein [candidate division WOR-3 bacterium]
MLALQGNLEDFDLTDVLQLIHLGKKNGALEIETLENRGEIYFENGKVVYAKTKEMIGEESIHYILRWTKGKFVFSPEKRAPEKRMNIPIQNLILDAAKQIDEWKRIEKIVPSVEMIVDFVEDPDVSSEEINLSPDEWKILSLITGERSIRDVAQLAKLTEFNTAKIFYGLISSGLVNLKRPTKKEEKKEEEKEEKKEVKKKRGFFRRG